MNLSNFMKMNNKMLIPSTREKSRRAGNDQRFINYLKSKEMSSTTIETYVIVAERFLSWLKTENMEVEQVRHQDILAFMKHCQKKGASQRTVQHYLGCIKLYYDHLAEITEIKGNPVESIKVQGVKRKMLYQILEPHELNAIYHHYQSEVAGGKKSNGRTLQLESHQVLDVYEYVMEIRPKIIGKTGQQVTKLFISQEPRIRISFLMNQLRKQHPKLKNADQIRASVIVKWLKQYNLREVQYLAGHRYISSTEAYQQNEVEGLSEEVNRYHPLG